MSNHLSKMSGLYFLSYVPLGMLFPYFVTEFEARGVEDIGLLIAMPPFTLIVVGPLWGYFADWIQQSVRVLQLAIWLSAVGLIGVVFFETEWVWMGMLLFSIGWAPVASLADAMTLEGIRQRKETEIPKYTYGSIRQWGSIGYMVGVMLVGYAVGWGIRGGTVAVILLGLYAFLIPGVTVQFPRPKWESVRTLLQNRALLWILFCAALHFSVHLGSSSYIMKHAQEIEVSVGWTSIAIAMGVIVEIVVFQRAGWFEQFSPNRLLVFTCALAIPRWWLMWWGTSVEVLVFAQALHGITFGLFWLAVVRLVNAITPSELAATGQSLLSTAVGGVGAVVGMYGASWMVEQYSTVDFYAVSIGVALVGTICSLGVQWKPAV